MILFRCLIVLAAGLLLSVQTKAADVSPGAINLAPVFKQYCNRCHGGKKTKGDVDLKQFSTAQGVANLGGHVELLEQMIEAIEFAEMPPEDEDKQPTEKQRAQWLAELNSILVEAIAVAHGAPLERTPLRRMNRYEYNNAVRDLFDLKVNLFALPEKIMREYGDYFQPASAIMPNAVKVGNRPLGKSQLIEKRLLGVNPFPQDRRAEHGYNNRGDHLTLSPLLMESFLSLSQSIIGAENFKENCGQWNEFFAAPFTQSKPEKQQAIARKRLSTFLQRAFRGQVEPELLNRYMARFNAMAQDGIPFEDRMKSLASAALVSPRFLYMNSSSPNNNDLELASRLSFYLWSSLPDQELITLAQQGRLSNPEILDAQVQRMMSDRKLKGFTDSFPAQWLQLDRIIGAIPDPDRYPNYYFAKFRVGMYMMLEPLLLFEALLIENRPITQLIDSDFSYRSEPLSHWYTPQGLGKGVRLTPTTIAFNRVPVNDRRYGGVITNAAVMTMTSSPLRTQPITRGAWIASVIFNDPPAPPPAVVPLLEEDDEKIEATGLTLRQQLEAHRDEPDCAGCHLKIDPLGFALEQYDPVGRWRDTYRTGLSIDATGKLFNKHPFNDAIDFKDAILKEKDRFLRALTEHLLAYALGRKLGAGDRNSIDQIVANVASSGYGLQTLVKQVALSPSFTGQSPLGDKKISE